MIHKTSLLLVITTLLLAGCANQSQPTGGPKDEEPPILEYSTPSAQSLNVETDRIELTFNEYVKVNNPKEQLIITPRLDMEYDMKYRKNKVIITFDDYLPDSTTFTFNFRESIQDITEGNAPENLSLAFSTGHYLDSMQLGGTINLLLEGTTAENATVALYEHTDTLDLFTGPPLYFTKTDQEGNYNFTYIKKGIYYLYAYIDNNKNLTVEPQSEYYGFLTESIILDTTMVGVNLDLVLLDSRPLELQSDRQSGTSYNLQYNKHIIQYDFFSPDTSLQIVSNFTDDSHTNIRIYNTFPIADSLETFIEATDSLYRSSLDTIYIKYEETQRSPEEFSVQLLQEDVIVEERLLSGELLFNKPVNHVNLDSAYIYIDSTHIYPIDSTLLTWNNYGDRAMFEYTLDKALFEENKDAQDVVPQSAEPVENDTTTTDSLENIPPRPELKPHVRFAANTFISAENDSSQNISTDLSFSRANQLGTIIVEINTAETNYFVQLLNTRGEVVQETLNKKQFEFKYISPGTYRIRILVDSNGDGIWYPGNINENISPEPLYYYSSSTNEQEITIRANFELVPDPISF